MPMYIDIIQWLYIFIRLVKDSKTESYIKYWQPALSVGIVILNVYPKTFIFQLIQTYRRISTNLLNPFIS